MNIRLIGVQGKIVLVVILRWVEGGKRCYFRDNRIGIVFRVVGPFDGSQNFGFFGGCPVEGNRAIITTNIGSLTVQRRGIMTGKEGVKELGVADDFGIVIDLYRFGMARYICTNLFVGWVLTFPPA